MLYTVSGILAFWGESMMFHQRYNSVGNYSYNRFWYHNVFWRLHFHRNIEVIYVQSGCVCVTVGERQKLLQAGQFAMVLPNEPHGLQSQGDSVCWVGVFSADFIPAFAVWVKGKEGSDFVFTCKKTVEDFLCTELMQKEVPATYLLKSCLYAVCDAYCSQIELHPRKEKSDLLIHAVTEYISLHYREKLTLRDLADQLGYNYHYLSKRIGGIFRQSFSEILNSYRLDAALSLLMETDDEIATIALESGFQSIRSFNDYFKSRTGLTPVQYRAERK